jgi:hypothetical protein
MAKKRAITNDELTKEERADLLHFYARHDAFATDDARRTAWETHRESLMAAEHAGHRPYAYWQYDQPEIQAQRMELETDVQLLWRFGLLTTVEVAELRAGRYWPIRPCLGLTPKQLLEDNLDWSAILGVY